MSHRSNSVQLSPLTLEQGTELPDGHRALSAELAGAHLKEEHGEPHQDQGYDIRNEEGTWGKS